MGTWHANFITYENKRNPHISIHKNGCNQIKKNGGSGEGKYIGFINCHVAKQYAESTNLPIINCSYCNPAN